MNESDPSKSNGSNSLSSTESQEASQSVNKSPLLSSLLTKQQHDTTTTTATIINNISNGQQDKTRNAHNLMMPSSAAGTSAIVVNPQYDETNYFKKTVSPHHHQQQQQHLKSPSSADIIEIKEIDLTKSSSPPAETQTANSHNRRYNNLSELLQRNNNNNTKESATAVPITTTAAPTAKSILENCLLNPSPVKGHHRVESQQYYHHHHHHNNKMDESEYHAVSGSTSATSVLKFAPTEENRKVEPLKINLNREPIRTVIKLQPSTHGLDSSPTKITIKPPQPPERNSILHQSPNASISISPTLSSSSSISSESSYDSFIDSSQQQQHHHSKSSSTMQVVPKLHLRTPLNNEQSELHIVPKLTITGLNSPQPASIHHSDQLQQQQQIQQQQQNSIREHNMISSNSSIVNNLEHSPAIPKLTIKKDNNTTEGFYHLNHETNAIPKLHIKTNHIYPHHHHHQPQQHNTQKESMKLTIKSVPDIQQQQQDKPPVVPKLTIKTTDNDTMTIVNDNANELLVNQQQATIPKLTIKANQQTVTPKLTIKPIVRRASDEPLQQQQNQQQSQLLQPQQEESIPKLTLKAVNNSASVPTFEKVVPKLVVKLPKESQQQQHLSEDEEEEKESSSSNSSTPSPPPIVQKLNIKPIPFPESKEVPKQPVKNCIDLTATSDMKFSINRLIESSSEQESKYDQQESHLSQNDNEGEEMVKNDVAFRPLEINTSAIKNADSGQDSPRIILKINKTNNESITTEIINPQTTDNVQKSIATATTVNNKRSHPSDTTDKDEAELSKKPKLNDDDDDVIIINDSDASSEASMNKNLHHQQPTMLQALQEAKASDLLQTPLKSVEVEIASTPVTASTGRSLRQSRRNQESAAKDQPKKQEKLSKKHQQQNNNNNNKSSPVIQEQDQNSQTSLKNEDSQSSEIDPLALSNDGTANSNSVDELITPKRGRGRPKKVPIEKLSIEEGESQQSRDPLEIPTDSNEASSIQQVENSESSTLDTPSLDKMKTPGSRRGRGRGRLKRTVEVMKNGKPVQITLEGHDDDDSPSFSLYNRSLRGGFTAGRRSKGNKSIRGKGTKSSPFITPERSKDGSSYTFMTPSSNNSDFKDNNRKKLFNTPSLFEEDTRMSIGGGDSQSQSLLKSGELNSNEESQSSILSSTSNTIDGTAKKRAKKMEVCEPEGRTEFSVDMIAEYEWPQNENNKNRDTFMIQEQIAEYLGVKSFKRKYPDLVRRPVDMEERNFLFEHGLASEKMCDLGLTAVYASEVLDIMCNDYVEKYEEYKRYQREKIFRNARLRLETAVVDRSQMQKDKAISSTSEWNSRFNKDRRENRRCCMDLQNFLVQKPTPVRHYKLTPAATYTTSYPVSLVPGQFSEYYEKYTPEQLACYPINSVLVDYKRLEEYMSNHPNPYESSDSSDSSDDDDNNEIEDKKVDEMECKDSSTDSDSSDSDSSSDDDYEDPMCKVCSQTPFTNQYNQPEKFITCSTCKNQAHPSCIEMSQRMYVRSLAYKWQCSNCKRCCKCNKKKDNKMIYCVQCDRGFHLNCLGLRNVPEGQYHCVNCTICSECGAKTAEGHFNPSLTQQQRQELAMIAQWNHEFVENPLTNIREHKASLCLPCSRRMNQKKVEE